MLFQDKTSDLRVKFLTIRQRPISTSIKISLMETILHELKSYYQTSSKSELPSLIGSEKHLQFSETNFTEAFSVKNTVLPPQTREQIQCRIIEQQRTKVQLYDEIQLHQDDLFQLQKVIKSKKQYEQNLDKRIFELQYLIQKNSKTQTSEQKHQKKPISARIKKFFM